MIELQDYSFSRRVVESAKPTFLNWKNKYPTHELPTEEGIYLTFCFTSGQWRYPRLYWVWKGPKSGRLYACLSHDKGRRRNDLKSEFFNTCWIKVEPPDDDPMSLGGEWFNY